MLKFVISVSKNGEFQFEIEVGNGDVIFTSESYTSKFKCIKGLASLKLNSRYYQHFENKTSINGAFGFNLKSSSGNIVFVSPDYTTESIRDNVIEIIKRYAVNAATLDNTI